MLVFESVSVWPLMTTLPEVIDSSEFRHRRNVLLPEPDGPMTHTTSCSSTLQSMPLSTSFAPNFLCRSSTSITEFSYI